MAIKFREDADLQVLASANKDDLKVLVDYLTLDKDGKTRLTEELLDDEAFKKANGDFPKAWKSIAAELQLFGGDTMANMIRGHGVSYHEILCDVCDRLKISINKKAKAYEIENAVLKKMVESAWKDLSPDARTQWASSMDINGVASNAMLDNIIHAILKNPLASYQASAILSGGMAYAIFGNIARYVGMEAALSIVGGRAVFGMLGPLGLLLGGLFTLPTITGPAMRVTIPSVIQVAFIRRKIMHTDRY